MRLHPFSKEIRKEMISQDKDTGHQSHAYDASKIFHYIGGYMKCLISCEFNMDTNCVELTYTDGTMLAIDTIAVENEYAEDMYQRSELDWLIYNAPLEYADLILNGDVEGYLKRVTQYRPLDEQE